MAASKVACRLRSNEADEETRQEKEKSAAMTAVFGIVKDQERATQAIDRFQGEGFGRGEISIIAPELPEEEAIDMQEVQARKIKQGTLTGAGAGAIIGGSLGWFAGWGGFVFPGMGPLVAAGPWAMGIIGAIIGGLIGATIAGPVCLATFRNIAKPIEHGLDSGQVLVGVQTHDEGQVHTAKKVFATLEASEVTTDVNPHQGKQDIHD
jgi:outer membrane lipoprotein SlyB